jgi:hypothetical protein
MSRERAIRKMVWNGIAAMLVGLLLLAVKDRVAEVLGGLVGLLGFVGLITGLYSGIDDLHARK